MQSRITFDTQLKITLTSSMSNQHHHQTAACQLPAPPTHTKVSSGLKGMIINCNGLKGPSHFSEFQVLLDFHKPDIILHCEPKLDCKVPTFSVFPPTYSMFRKDRNRIGRGGWVFQAIKSEIVCKEMPNFGKDCEILWSSVKIGNCKTLHLASCYNSPQDVLEQFSDSFYCVFESSYHHPNIITAGEFNLGDIDWSAEVPFANNSVLPPSALHNRLHVKCVTRPTSGKTLDLLFTSYPNVISDVHTIPVISDHLTILFQINVKASRSFKPPHKIFDYKRVDFDGLKKSVSNSAENFLASAPQNFAVEDNSGPSLKLLLQRP